VSDSDSSTDGVDRPDDGIALDEPVAVDRAFRCADCGRRWYYQRRRCPDCSGTDATTYGLGTGELVAVTRVEMTPPDVRSPNRLGLASFDGVRLIAQLADEALSPGDAVAFAGANRLRDGDEALRPRLDAVDESSE
jgi:uncharacterized OB-fold protein